MSLVMEDSSSRINILAQHKRTPPGFIEDRRSVYWVDKLPPRPKTKCHLTKRQQELVHCKPVPNGYIPDRPSPIRQVKDSALAFKHGQRIEQLAQAKLFHPAWTPMRSVYTEISESTLKATPTKRLVELARSKQYDPLLIKSNSSWDWGVWESDVPKESLAHNASARLDQLAEPKPTSGEYRNNRPVIWPVSAGARSAQPTTRQQQLAKPKTRAALDQDYDPYKVSFAARFAVASPRVCELSTAIPRKIRAKKTV